jgi:hypothetical protein
LTGLRVRFFSGRFAVFKSPVTGGQLSFVVSETNQKLGLTCSFRLACQLSVSSIFLSKQTSGGGIGQSSSVANRTNGVRVSGNAAGGVNFVQ